MPRTALDERVRVFGIRHHGPGSARSLLAALDEWAPDVVLIEGPSDAQEAIGYLTDPELVPPVAALVYSVENPRCAAYYPFAEFSPEFQAMRWARGRGVPASFIDLPGSTSLGYRVGEGRAGRVLDELANASGFDDGEDWWEHLVEQRSDPRELFKAIAQLMTAVREHPPERADEEDAASGDDRLYITDRDYEDKREAHMRRALRAALNVHEKVAVVCGAWHVPALRDLPPVRQDDEALKGLPKVKVGMTVIPWTFERLTFASGYGAGVRSPQFYDLLWSTPPEETSYRWLLLVARLLRKEDLDASPASVIEAVRLADALASLRGRSRPGLRELAESARSILGSDEAMWRLIERSLVVGQRMGSVPSRVPAPPLQADLAAIQKRLRLKVDDQDRVLNLDLRNETDLERSRLFHRLTMLGVHWALSERVHGKKGTFHEDWRTKWRPEIVIELVEAGVHGNTVISAATQFATSSAGQAGSLAVVAGLVESILLADLAEALDPVIAKLQSLSATTTDVGELIDALVPLSAVLRYGTVRRFEADQVKPVADALYARICVGLPGACLSLDQAGAEAMAGRLDSVNGIVRLEDRPEESALWLATLQKLAELRGGHPLVAGRAERLRFDLNAVDGDWLALRLGQEASRGATAPETAAFVEGLLAGSGAVLIHHRPLLDAVDSWVAALDESLFDSVLPLVRRTFSTFSKPERRQIGELISGGVRELAVDSELDMERATSVLPVIRQILGLSE